MSKNHIETSKEIIRAGVSVGTELIFKEMYYSHFGCSAPKFNIRHMECKRRSLDMIYFANPNMLDILYHSYSLYPTMEPK
jgi:hypothetical protein